MQAQNASLTCTLGRVLICCFFMPAVVYPEIYYQHFFDPKVRYLSIHHASSVPVRYRYLFDPPAVIARSPQSQSPCVSRLLNTPPDCLPWPNWRRSPRTRRRGSYLLSPRPLLRWHVEPTYVQVQIALTYTDTSQYAYSAWAPQFADKLQLSATQSNVIVRVSPPSSSTEHVSHVLGTRSEHGHVCLGYTSWSHNG